MGIERVREVVGVVLIVAVVGINVIVTKFAIQIQNERSAWYKRTYVRAAILK